MIILFGLPGLLLLFIVAIVAAASTRVCPYCAERIKKAATACRHCGRDVGDLRPLPDLPELDPSYPKPSPWPLRVMVTLLGAAVIAFIYAQSSTPSPPAPQGARTSAFQAGAPAMLPPAAPFVDAPIATATSPKPLPKDTKPRAPAGPLNIAPK